jgi:hypothetical protein
MPPRTPKTSLVVEIVPIDTLLPHPENPRSGDVGVIADSLTAHGQFKPIVVQKSTRHVLAGNHTMFAAQSLGWENIEAVFVDVDDEKARRILLIDNRSSDMGRYDDEVLVKLLQELPDLTGTGYTPADLDDLLTEQMLPQPLRVATHESEGERVAGVTLQWGFVQFGTKRVQISKAEVDELDKLYAEFVDQKGSDAGFGWALVGQDDVAGSKR